MLPYKVPLWFLSTLRWVVKYYILQMAYSKEDAAYVTRQRLGYTKNRWHFEGEEGQAKWLEKKLWTQEGWDAYQEELREKEREALQSSGALRRKKRLMARGEYFESDDDE